MNTKQINLPEPLPNALVGALVETSVRDGVAVATLRVTEQSKLSDLYVDGVLNAEWFTRSLDILQEKGSVILDLGPVDNPIEARPGERVAPTVGWSRGDLDLSSMLPIPPAAPTPNPWDMDVSDSSMLQLVIPCVDPDCDGNMRLEVNTVGRFPWPWPHRKWRTEMYFWCTGCLTKTSTWSRSNTDELIREGLFSLRAWALRGMPKPKS